MWYHFRYMEIISFDDFKKLDLRIGTVVDVQAIEGADKLWKLTIDLGPEDPARTIAAGVKEYYGADELLGKQVPIVANLEPRVLKGTESQGMVLMAVGEENRPVLITPLHTVPRGTVIR